MYNTVTLIGRAGCDAEIRYTPNQTKVASFRLATSRAWTDQAGNRQEKTEWHNIVCWGRLADRAESMVTKGALVMVEGSIEYSNWEHDGQKRYRTDIRAGMFLMLSRKGATQGHQGANAPAGTNAPDPEIPETYASEYPDDWDEVKA